MTFRSGAVLPSPSPKPLPHRAARGTSDAECGRPRLVGDQLPGRSEQGSNEVNKKHNMVSDAGTYLGPSSTGAANIATPSGIPRGPEPPPRQAPENLDLAASPNGHCGHIYAF